jgi:hypothetical protein
VIPRREWPAATIGFLEGRSEVNETVLIREGLRWPVMSPLDADVIAWARAALTGLKWRQAGKGSDWRKPAMR